MPDRACLPGHAAALDLDHRVIATFGPGDAEWHLEVGFVDGAAEVLRERATVDNDLSLAGEQPDPGHCRLPTARPGVEGLGGHVYSSCQARGFGCWAS